MKELLDESPNGTTRDAASMMRRQVLTVDAGAPLEQAWQAMREARVEHAVVLHHGSCIGVVGLPDIWVAWSLELAPVSSRSVLALVAAAPWVPEDTPLPQLCQVLLGSDKGAVMVLSTDGDLLGLVTANDVLAVLASEDQRR